MNRIEEEKAEAAAAAESNDHDTLTVTQNSGTTFKQSFFEIFNEHVYDLLSSNSLDKPLAVREDKITGAYVEGLKEIEVGDAKSAEELLAKGLENRQVASTNMNRTSSRSHAIFVLAMKTEYITSNGLQKVRNSKFTLVDLAGSERQKSSGTCTRRNVYSELNVSLAFDATTKTHDVELNDLFIL